MNVVQSLSVEMQVNVSLTYWESPYGENTVIKNQSRKPRQCSLDWEVNCSTCWVFNEFSVSNLCGRSPDVWQMSTTVSRGTVCWRSDPPPTWRNFTSSSATASYVPPSGDWQAAVVLVWHLHTIQTCGLVSAYLKSVNIINVGSLSMDTLLPKAAVFASCCVLNHSHTDVLALLSSSWWWCYKQGKCGFWMNLSQLKASPF